ncbi:hypothetical protein ACFWDF_15845 [Streptomyces diastaticus]|uniref:hypothetical protein n=1 Tax=Streptomyces diastaticus TaxID=1956 RepID=UPI0036A82353
MVSAAPDVGRCLVRLRDGGAGGGGGAALGTALARPEPVVAAYAVRLGVPTGPRVGTPRRGSRWWSVRGGVCAGTPAGAGSGDG